MKSLIPQNKKKKKLNELPRISIINKDECNSPILSSIITTKYKNSIMQKLPSNPKAFIEKLKRDFSIAEFNQGELIKKSKQNTEILKDIKIRQYQDIASNLMKNKEKLKLNKNENIYNTWDGIDIEPSYRRSTLSPNKRGKNKEMTYMLQTINDINNNLNQITKKLIDRSDTDAIRKKYLNNKKINLEFLPCKQTGIPQNIKTKFSKETVNNFRRMTGKFFGGVSERL